MAQELQLSTRLEENIAAFSALLSDIQTVILRRVENLHDPRLRAGIFYIDGMVNSVVVNESIIERLQRVQVTLPLSEEGRMQAVLQRIISVNEVKLTDRQEELIQGVIYGDTVLFLEGCSRALVINTKGFSLRSGEEPENEKVLRGPHEGFNEGIIANLAKLRRLLRTPDLKMEFSTFGVRSNTRACICYIDGVANRAVLRKLRQRLEGFGLDAALDANYLAEWIRDVRFSPFKTVGTTERPDVVAGKLLEGRIAVFLDGTPEVLTVPYLFVENFQSSEDYYVNFFYAGAARLLRILGFFLTVLLPAFYVAVVCYHQELLPTRLLVSISMARQSVPLPTVVEAFLMLLVFQLLAETGIRMSHGIGQAMSIVGALVIGQSAVEARIVSAPIIIVVGLTGISALLVPRLNAATIVVRFLLLAAASVLGLYGLSFAFLALILHLCGIHSFGVPFCSAIGASPQENKDLMIRAPWWLMRLRPAALTENRIRMKQEDRDA